MTNLAEILKKDPLYPVTPCQYCTNPVGYGDHERYCSQNPENLARTCSIPACRNVGNNINGVCGWMCKDHNDLLNAQANLRSCKGSLGFAHSQIASLRAKANETEAQLPKMYKELEESEENLKKVKFKMALDGTKA